MGPLKDSFVEKGKGKFYLGKKEPVKVAGINVPGFKIFKEIVMKKVTEKIRTEAVEELLCLPPNE